MSLLIVIPSVAAHEGGAIPADVWTHWNFDPLILMGVLLTAVLYGRGVKERDGRLKMACFAGGLALVGMALVSPVDALGGALFSGHMIQHLLLVLGAAPLLAFSQPLPALLRGVPRGVSKSAARVFYPYIPLLHRLAAALTGPLTVSVLHVAALWVWHVPALYSAAITHEALHALEHLCFFGTALLYWGMIVQHRDHGGRVLSVFIVMMASGLLGALMTFARTPWYTDHAPFVAAWGLTLVEDQQMAGLLMWIPSGVVYVIVAAALLAAWISAVEQRVTEQERQFAQEGRNG